MKLTIDIETYDPLLFTKGPSIRYGKGCMLTLAICCAETGMELFYTLTEWTGNFTKKGEPEFRKTKQHDLALRVLAAVMRSSHSKIFANAGYELAWFYGLGVWDEYAQLKWKEEALTKARMYDILVDASLETGTYGFSLESCSIDRGLPLKPITQLIEAICLRLNAANKTAEARAIERAGGKREAKSKAKISTDVRAWLWILTSDPAGRAILRDYNLHDIRNTEAIHLSQWKNPESLAPVFELESLLIPVIALMVNKGVKVDSKRIVALRNEIISSLDVKQKELDAAYGFPIDINLSTQTKTFLAEQHTFPLTPKSGKPSVTAASIMAIDDPRLQLLATCRKLAKMESTFLASLVQGEYEGRVYPRISQIKTHAGGTETGRLAYQGINLQNQPKIEDADDLCSEEKLIIKAIRQCFLPDDGTFMVSADYSAQEPRVLAHLAGLEGADGGDALVKAYTENPLIDFHEWTKDMCNNFLSSLGAPLMTRKQAKPINLGIPYGSGGNKIAAQVCPGNEELGFQIYGAYNKAIPSPMWLRKFYSNKVEKELTTETMLGRKRLFGYCVNVFKAAKIHGWDDKTKKKWMTFWGKKSMTVEEVRTIDPTSPICVARSYSALNTIIQGTSADQTKLAMIRMFYMFGIIPLIQVHDELIFCVPESKFKMVKRIIKTCMVQALELMVPVVVGYEIYERGWMTKVVKEGVVQ